MKFLHCRSESARRARRNVAEFVEVESGKRAWFW
jgi:hypothetical protein